MRTLLLERDYKQWAAQLKGTHADPSHVKDMINEDTIIVAPDMSITAVLLKECIEPKRYERACRMWRRVKQVPTNRITAVGSRLLPKLRADGSISARQAIPRSVEKLLREQGVAQGMLGYVDASADGPCRMTALTIQHPEWVRRNLKLIRHVDRTYKRLLPSYYAIQLAEIAKAGCCRIDDTVFSTIYINKRLRCAFHPDTGNLRGVVSALMPMGNYTGGELVLGRWRVGIKLRPGDLLFFDPQQLHGNLPIKGDRVSAIFYCERRIAEGGKQLIPRYPRT